MEIRYNAEKNVQILIALMKEHGIKKVIASPGTTNISFVGSIQNDPYFEVYSCVDERSAAYMACGLAAESGEPVALSCTGATASRNYIPAITEAYYRNLPVLAITSTQYSGRIGQYIPQVIDRTQQINDTYKYTVQIPMVNTEEDKWACELKLNEALLSLKYKKGGPVHINLETNYSLNFSEKELPKVKVIRRIFNNEKFPEITQKRVAIFIGAHFPFNDEILEKIEKFCEKYNAVVIGDHTSNYKGNYYINVNLNFSQDSFVSKYKYIDLLIHLGDVSGAYLSIFPKEVWRVSEDGVIRDTFKKLTYVFEMKELEFFKKYEEKEDKIEKSINFYLDLKEECKKIEEKIEDIPFSNGWIAYKSIEKIPESSVVHLGILNTLRNWNFFNTSKNINFYSNTGGFGIDGIISTLIGASFNDLNKLYFGILGDLAFFYDLNSLGNREVKNNIRLLLINNGKGTEFRNYNHNANYFGEKADDFMAAAGHFGNKSKNLVKNFAENLGYEYLSASTKEEYLEKMDYFFSETKYDKPIIFEVFTDSKDESDALRQLRGLEKNVTGNLKNIVKGTLGKKGIEIAKKVLKK